MTVEVKAYQWWWSVRYRGSSPSESFETANEIHIPVGEPVRIELASDNVIHSFWVPALSGKLDVIPGQTNVLWLQADRPGIYRGQCAEYCGVQHARMAFYLVAMKRADFDAWRQRQLQAHDSAKIGVAQQGQQLFLNRCGICHKVRGTAAGGQFGPDLTHLMERRTLAAGTLENSRENLRQWIEHPQAVKPGNHMPDIDLSPDESEAVLAYLESLQ